MKRWIAFFLCLVLCAALLPAGALAAEEQPQTGWNQIDGNWYYTDKDGAMQTGWNKHGSIWYYFNVSSGAPYGAMVTGWNKIGGRWYYMNEDGAMQTGWLELGDKEYYLSSSGAMVTGWQKINNLWYYFNADGSLRYGWLKYGNAWYYLGENGVMQTGLLYLDDTYYFTSSGKMYTGSGWKKADGNWYYFNADGTARTGWLKYGGYWYYLTPSMCVSGPLEIDGIRYYADSAGHVTTAAATGWEHGYSDDWYYYKDNVKQTGWLYSGGHWYYLRSSDGQMIWSCPQEIDGKNYVFTDSGALSTGGWVYCHMLFPETGWGLASTWYYANSDGTARTGWLEYGGAWYYLDPAAKGAMVTGDFEIDGVTYSFSNSGALIP